MQLRPADGFKANRGLGSGIAGTDLYPKREQPQN
jgi:hypothetical protein